MRSCGKWQGLDYPEHMCCLWFQRIICCFQPDLRLIFHMGWHMLKLLKPPISVRNLYTISSRWLCKLGRRLPLGSVSACRERRALAVALRQISCGEEIYAFYGEGYWRARWMPQSLSRYSSRFHMNSYDSYCIILSCYLVCTI